MKKKPNPKPRALPTRNKSIRFTVDEWEAIDKAAEAAGMSTHAWIRAIVNAALGSALPEQLDRVRSDSETTGFHSIIQKTVDGKKYRYECSCGWYGSFFEENSLVDPIARQVQEHVDYAAKIGGTISIADQREKTNPGEPKPPVCACGSIMAIDGEFDGRTVWICPGCAATRDK
jgi:hypothetical protein